jgi:putative tricarboxylic transport membrane protein
MRFSDALSGILTIILGVAVVVAARGFPPAPGQPIGPSYFPIVIGCGLVGFGAWLAAASFRTSSGPWIELDAWARRPRMALNFALVVGDLVVYALVVDWLGFFLTGILFLSVLFMAFGVSHSRILPVAVVVTFLIHYGFYTLLRVPLPWGVLGGIAW